MTRAPSYGIAVRFKNNAMRGSTIENVYVCNTRIGQVAQAALAIDFYYEEGPKGLCDRLEHVLGLSMRNMRINGKPVTAQS